MSISLFWKECAVQVEEIFFFPWSCGHIDLLILNYCKSSQYFFHPLYFLLHPKEFQKYFYIHLFLRALHLKCGVLGASASNNIKMNAWQYGRKIKQWSKIRHINIMKAFAHHTFKNYLDLMCVNTSQYDKLNRIYILFHTIAFKFLDFFTISLSFFTFTLPWIPFISFYFCKNI